jgi:lipid-A-disaccharide synthase
MSAGEVSGDAAGARVAAEILRRAPDTRLAGVGGKRMRAAGVAIDVDSSRLASVGVSEPFSTLPALAAMVRALRRRVRDERPHAALLIGYDLFHVALARWLRRQGVPAISYFPPQVWLWRVFAGPMARSFDSVLTCFGEEQEVYAGRGVETTFVGHYLCDELSPVEAADRAAARAALGLGAGSADAAGGVAGQGGAGQVGGAAAADDDAPAIVGLLPGSRTQEVRALLPALLDAAARLLRDDPRRMFVLPVAEPHLAAEIGSRIAAHGLRQHVTLTSDSHLAMRASDVLVIASGTACLEATLLRVPMVIVCNIGMLSLATVRLSQALRLLATERVGIPNLLLRRAAVPELLQGEVTGERVASAAGALLASRERRDTQRAALAEAAAQVSGEGSAGRVAEWVLHRASQRAAAGAAWPVGRARFEAGAP